MTTSTEDPDFRTVNLSPEELLARLEPPEALLHLRGLQSVTEAMLAHLSLPELLRELLNRLRDMLSVDTATVLLCEEGGQTLAVRASRGLEEEVEEHVRIPFGRGVAGTVAKRLRPVIVDDVSRIQTVSPFLRKLSSMMVAPLLVEGSLLGVLHVGALGPRAFRDTELYLLQVVADRVALAIKNALLFDEKQKEAREQVRAAEARRESEERYRRLVEVSPEMIAVHQDGVFRYINPAGAELLGAKSPDEIVGRSIHDFLHPESRESIQERIRGVYEEGTPAPLVAEKLVRLDGETLEVEVRGVPIPYEGGMAVQVLARDISQRRRDERAQRFLAEAGRVLASSLDVDATLRRVADLAVAEIADYCTVYLLNPDESIRRGVVAHADPQKEALVQEIARSNSLTLLPEHPAYRVIHSGEPQLVALIPPEAIEAAAESSAYGRLLRDLNPRSYMMVPLRGRDGITGAIALVTADSGRRYGPDDLALAEELARRAAIAVDNARLYEDARTADRAKSEFLAVMSHELRTPLNAIIGYTDLLMMGVPEPISGTAQQQLERIRSSGRHLLDLIDEILTFAGLESGREVVEPRATRLAEVVAEVVAIIEPLAQEKGLSLAVEGPVDEVEIVTDRRKLRQVLVNLASNAVKFTSAGDVRIRVAPENGRLRIEVSDTGIGIANENRKKIFEPFWQVEQSNTRQAGGTGLGLTVARRLLEAMGGTLEVESEPGVGTTFRVTLSLTPATNAPGKPESRERP